MLSPLRSRTYRHLFAAQVIALLGTGLATVALGLIAFQIAGAEAGASANATQLGWVKPRAPARAAAGSEWSAAVRAIRRRARDRRA